MGPPRGFAVIEMELTGREGLYITPMDSIAEPRPLVVSSAEHHSPAISADGRTVAWVSDESGERQVYAQPLPGPGARVQVSVNGGTEPVWSRAGSTLFYRQTTGRILSAEVSGTPLRVVRHDSLSFVDAYVTVGGGTGRNWDVFPGDREFLFVRPRAAQQSRAYVVVNWTQLLTSAAGAAVVER